MQLPCFVFNLMKKNLYVRTSFLFLFYCVVEIYNTCSGRSISVLHILIGSESYLNAVYEEITAPVTSTTDIVLHVPLLPRLYTVQETE